MSEFNTITNFNIYLSELNNEYNLNRYFKEIQSKILF